MWTVSQMSRISGVSVRTLHHYDAIGLLRPSQLSPAGYRLYDQAALERLAAQVSPKAVLSVLAIKLGRS